MNTIEILHQELPTSHDTGFSSQLITQLGLKLVDRHRQVLVAVNVLSQHVHDRLFVRPSQPHLLVTRLQFSLKPDIDQLIVPATRCLPDGLGL